MSDTTQTRRRYLIATAGAALTAGLAGCSSASQSGGDGHNHGEGGQDNHSEATGSSGEGAEVTMITNDSGNHFEPHVVRIQPGETVTWSLESGAHSTTAYASENDKPQRIPDGAEGWDSGTLSEQGATFEHTFETEGVYDYFCIPHEGSGMLGSVVVGEPTLDEEPGMAEPQSSLADGAQEKIRELNEMVRNGGDGGHSEDSY